MKVVRAYAAVLVMSFILGAGLIALTAPRVQSTPTDCDHQCWIYADCMAPCSSDPKEPMYESYYGRYYGPANVPCEYPFLGGACDSLHMGCHFCVA
jgi:hypothetical protein